MKKMIITLIIFLLIGISLTSSGCIDNTKSNSTWGEKKISLDAIKVDNDTISFRNERNTSFYSVMGNITNKNSNDAFNVKIEVTTYDSQGKVFSVNNTPYLEQKTILANGRSYFYAKFYDPDQKIVRFDVKILDAKAEFGT